MSDQADGQQASLLDLIARPVALVRFDGAARVRLNPAACSLLALPFEPGAELDLAATIGGEAAEALAGFAEGMPRNGRGARALLACRTAGGPLPLAFDLARAPGDCFVATIGPVDADAGSANELKQLYAVLQTLPVGVELYDPQFNALYYNAKSDELFDYSDGAVPTHDGWWRLAFPDPSVRNRAMAQWREIVAAARSEPSRAHMAEWTVRCKDGGTRAVQFFYRFLGDRFSLVLWDVTAQRQLESELRTTAGTDSLTGLANRRGFLERADRAVAAARAEGLPLALLMLDVDRFKSINDRFGHAAGDQALKAVAERAAGALRSQDVIGRLGGEEFVAVLPGATPAQARRVAERMRRAARRKPVLVGGEPVAITVSVGAAVMSDADPDSAALIERADRALYAAKAAGRDRVVFDQPD